jgi:hypothetical protein
MAQRPAFKPGDHVCVLYSGASELATVVADFLAEGVRLRQRCWYVAAGQEVPSVRSALRRRNVDVGREEARGALNLIEGEPAYVVQGKFDPERTVQVFNDAIEDALTAGFSGFRAAADMSWALSIRDGFETVVVYEALLRTLFATCRVTGLCLYDRERMPLKLLNGALVTHPIAGFPDAVATNPFYDDRATTMPSDDDRVIDARLQSLRRRSGTV